MKLSFLILRLVVGLAIFGSTNAIASEVPISFDDFQKYITAGNNSIFGDEDCNLTITPSKSGIELNFSSGKNVINVVASKNQTITFEGDGSAVGDFTQFYTIQGVATIMLMSMPEGMTSGYEVTDLKTHKEVYCSP